MTLKAIQPPNRDISVLRAELSEAERQLRAGEPNEEALLLWYGDVAREIELLEGMMEQPTIGDARKICERLKGARGVIVLAFGGDEVGGVSYGKTVRECKSLGRALDAIFEDFSFGRIEPWNTEGE